MKANEKNCKRGLIRRLLQSNNGNIGIMTAALILPLIGMVGSGVDFSRYFLVKSRLQLACDAGALAGRRAMEGGTFNKPAEKKAEQFFDTNFIDHAYGSEKLKRNYTEADGIVTGNASVRVDTAILQILDIDEFDIDVTCSSKLDIPDTDIMFVLDTTGSMGSRDGGSTRIKGLQGAVTSFVAKMQNTGGESSRIRYGFVPYSSNVNVGHLLKTDWMTGKVDIESREKLEDGYTEDTQETEPQKVSGNIDYSSSTVSSCKDENKVQTQQLDPINGPTTTLPDGTEVKVVKLRERKNGTKITCTSNGNGNGGGNCWWCWWGGGGSSDYTKETAVYDNVIYETTVTTTRKPYYTWRYKTVDYDLPGLIGSRNGFANPGQNSEQVAVGDMVGGQPTNVSVTWNGCIRELETKEITNFNTLPNNMDDVADIDINHIPGASDKSRWKMALPRLGYLRARQRYGGSLTSSDVTTDDNYIDASEYMACPTEAKALSEMSVSQVTQYINSLQAEGSTYHDIGLVWGGRLISPNGIYAKINDPKNDHVVTRHVIFMTDGDTAPSAYVMSSHGLEYLEPKRGPYSRLERQINGRTQLICDQIKGRAGATLWVIAFGPGITDPDTKANLEQCASDGSYFEASNSADLKKKFELIADRVAELRLVD